jgi:bifunctional isochorismate lyase / aryl carrier protein
MMTLPQRISYPMPDSPPVNTVGWQVDPDRAVLLVHDMQQYFVRGFDVDAEPLTTVIDTIATLRTAARSVGIPVIYTAQPGTQDPASRGLLTDFWGPGITSDPADTDIVPALAPAPDDVVLVKHRYSATVRTDLLERLTAMRRDQVIITGVYAHIGCLATALDLFMADVQPFVVLDAMADFSLDDHRRALDYAARRCAMVTDSSSVVAALTLTWLTAEIENLIGRPGAIAGQSDDLFEAGLDSIRAMALIDVLGDRGIEVDMVDLLAEPTLRGLHGCVRRSRVSSLR